MQEVPALIIELLHGGGQSLEDGLGSLVVSNSERRDEGTRVDVGNTKILFNTKIKNTKN